MRHHSSESGGLHKSRGELHTDAYWFFAIPIDPQPPGFIVHLMFLWDRSLGANSLKICGETCAAPIASGIRLLAITSDGDRACARRYRPLFNRFSGRLSDPFGSFAPLIGGQL
jgi:hypothetical protein